MPPARERDPLRPLFWDAAFATAVGSLNSGVVLVAYALYFGASNQIVGVLAAIPLLTQLLQAPAVVLAARSFSSMRAARPSSASGRTRRTPTWSGGTVLRIRELRGHASAEPKSDGRRRGRGAPESRA